MGSKIFTTNYEFKTWAFCTFKAAAQRGGCPKGRKGIFVTVAGTEAGFLFNV